MSEENKQRLKNNKKIIVKQKNQHKKLLSFFLFDIKMEEKFWFLIKKMLLKIYFINVKGQLVMMK